MDESVASRCWDPRMLLGALVLFVFLWADIRGDENPGPCLLLDLLQVAALLSNQPAHQAVVSEDFQRDLLRPASTGRHMQ